MKTRTAGSVTPVRNFLDRAAFSKPVASHTGGGGASYQPCCGTRLGPAWRRPRADTAKQTTTTTTTTTARTTARSDINKTHEDHCVVFVYFCSTHLLLRRCRGPPARTLEAKLAAPNEKMLAITLEKNSCWLATVTEDLEAYLPHLPYLLRLSRRKRPGMPRTNFSKRPCPE